MKRHLVTRCEDPRHTARTNTPGEAPVLCYQYCHNHPRNVKKMLGDADRVLRPHHRQARAEKEGSCVGVAVKVEEPNHL